MPHGNTDPKASHAAEVDPLETKEDTSEAFKSADQEVNAVEQTKDTTSGKDRESPTTVAPAEANGVQTPEQLAELLAADKSEARNVISWRVPHSPRAVRLSRAPRRAAHGTGSRRGEETRGQW